MALEGGDRYNLSVELKKYKVAAGAPNFNALLRIPFEDRIVGLVAKIGEKRVHMLITASIQLAMENLNLSKPMTPNQIFELTDTILDSCAEDYLGIEDLLLFLQKLVRGECGELFSSMDIAKFMKMFEKYRQDRHKELLRIREEQESQFRALGGTDKRYNNDKNVDPQTFIELSNMLYDEPKD